MKNSTYESPALVFTKTELFENVAAECWAKPSLYCLVDPTDEDNGKNCDLKYADLAGFTQSANGCNGNMIKSLKTYLSNEYGEEAMRKKGYSHYLTSEDITAIMKSGSGKDPEEGGGEGQPLKTSEYIIKVRS